MSRKNDKARDMARSLLPSTHRKGAKDDKAHEKRATRSQVNSELHKMVYDPEYYDDSDVDSVDSNVRYIVQDRRDGDKLAPFQRWAEAITKKKKPDDRLTYVKSLLPEGVIGEHALGHIQYNDHFMTKAEKQLERNIELNRQDKYAKKSGNKLDRDEAIQLLCEVIATNGLHKQMNAYIEKNATTSFVSESKRTMVFNEKENKWETKYTTIYLPYPPNTKRKKRKLLGMHDVESFYDDLAKNWPSDVIVGGKRYTNPEKYDGFAAMITFLKAVKDKKPLPKSDYALSLANKMKEKRK